MDYFEKARADAFDEVSKARTIGKIDKKTLGKKFEKFVEVWGLNEPVTGNEGIQTKLKMFVCFKSDFPLSFPSIYLDKESYEKVKYIPHVDAHFLICTYETETTSTNTGVPAAVVKATITKARQIIEAGIAKTNFADFRDEFMSYWEANYDSKEELNLRVLSLIEAPPDNNVKLLKLEKSFRSFDYVLYQENEFNKRFKAFLDEYGFKYKESEIFYAEELAIDDVPPYSITNKVAIEKIILLGEDKLKEFKRYLKQVTGPITVLFAKKLSGRTHYLGWFHPTPIIHLKGYRDGSITRFGALTTHQKYAQLQRFSPALYSESRIKKRTSGMEENSFNYKFLVAGIGSVGSNLIHFLNSLDYPEFKFIDPDWLSIDNIQRHLLGFSQVNANKALAMKHHLQLINPKQNITSKGQSVVEIFQTEPDYINEVDYIFVAIGKWNVEKWIAESIKEGKIKKPTFILWVEPYLAGGHCLFIHPDNFKHDEFYVTKEDKFYFKTNVISTTEYLKPENGFALKEAGCQTTYVPYSGSSVVSFLSSIFPEMLKIMNSKHNKSLAITWIGDKTSLASKNIKLSDFAKTQKEFTLVKNN